MTSYDQPRGSRETYEKLSDPAMYWTQVNGEPIREPVRQSGDETVVQPVREQSAPAHDETSASYDERAVWDEREPAYDDRDDAYREEEVDAATRFGGVNWGAGFFGWVVAVGVATLLTGIAGAAVAVLGRTVEVIPATLETDPRTTALVAAATLVAVLVVAYYAGGYVAGRMSRFDGGKQGAGVWVTGLMLSALFAGLGLVFVAEYDVFDRIDLPSVPLSTDAVGVAGLIAVVVVLICTLLAAIGGGKVGCRYHRKVDEYL